MRKNILSIHLFLPKGKMKWDGLFICIAFVLMSCEKGPECETWEVSDSNCTETGNCNYVGCNSYPSRTHEVYICGDDLNDARPNNTITVTTECVTLQRTYIRKL